MKRPVLAMAFSALMLLAGSSTLLAQEQTPTDSDGFLINVDLPKEKLDYQKVKAALVALGDKLDAKVETIALEEFITMLGVEKTEQIEQVLKAREKDMHLECQGYKCIGINNGDPVSIPVEADGKKITILLGKQIVSHLMLRDDRKMMQSCRLSGVKAKMGIITQDVNGAVIEIDDTQITKLRTSAGMGGDFPTDECDF